MEWKRAGMIAGVVAGVFLIMKYAVPVMLPFIFGFLLAMAALPAARKMADWKISRKLHLTEGGIGSILILLFTVGSILGIMWILQGLSGQVSRLIEWYPVLKKQFFSIIGQCCQQVEHTIGIPAKDSSDYIYTQLSHLGNRVFQNGGSVGSAVVSMKKCILIVGGIILAVVSAVLILQEYRMWEEKVNEMPAFRKFRQFLGELGHGIGAYVKAQFRIMGIIIVICIAGLFLLKTPHFIWLGLALGLLDGLPVLGTGTFLIPAAVVLALQGNSAGTMGCIVLYLVTSCVRQFLEPRLIGKKVGISPLLVFISIYLGVVLYGGTGFILGPLSVLVIYGILKVWHIIDYR